MNKLTLLSFATIALLGVSACDQQETELPPGEYESSRSSTNAQGTETTVETETDVDRDGDVRRETEVTRDPEGLFNQETETEVETYDQ